MSALVVFGLLVVALLGWFWWRTDRDFERYWGREFVKDFRAQFPDSCAVCSFTRWGRSHGYASAYDPIEPHPCPEGNDDGTRSPFARKIPATPPKPEDGE